jgi:hypothetical protein
MRIPRWAVMKWSRAVAVFCVSLVLLALATAVATSMRSDRDGGMANTHHGAGNLVLVF